MDYDCLTIRISGYLNLRILLYRAFLNLVVQKREKQLEVDDESLPAASKCIEMAMTLAQLIMVSINPGSSGTLQAALFHAMGCLWNATLTLLLYVRSESAQELLAATTPERTKIIDSIDAAALFFMEHQQALPFARTAAGKIQRLLKRVTSSYTGNTPSTTTDVDAGFTVSNFESPNQILNFMQGFDVQGFDVPQFNFGLPFPEVSSQGDILDPDYRQLARPAAEWTPEGEGFYFHPPSGAG